MIYNKIKWDLWRRTHHRYVGSEWVSLVRNRESPVWGHRIRIRFVCFVPVIMVLAASDFESVSGFQQQNPVVYSSFCPFQKWLPTARIGFSPFETARENHFQKRDWGRDLFRISVARSKAGTYSMPHKNFRNILETPFLSPFSYSTFAFEGKLWVLLVSIYLNFLVSTRCSFHEFQTEICDV